MALSITQRPIKSNCNFNAVGNPLVYRLQRTDYSFNQINNNSGKAQLQFNGLNHTAFFQNGNIVYINRAGYNVAAPVTASAFTGGNTLVTIDTPYVDSGTGGAINNSKRTDYIAAVEVFNSAGVAISPQLRYSPAESGEMLVDVSKIIRSYLSAEWKPVASNNQVEDETSLEFYISYHEYYDGNWSGAATSDSANKIIGVFAAMQIISSLSALSVYAHGGNMLSYYPVNANSLWLTKFARVSMWRGWPFTLSFLWPSGYTTIKRRVIQYDVAGEYVTSTTTSLTASGGKIHRMVVGSVNAATKKIEIALLDGSDAVITTTLIIDVKEPCRNIVHLFWKNSLGGDSFWQFDHNQEHSFIIRNGRKIPTLRLYAENLTYDEWEALNELNSATEPLPSFIRDINGIVKTDFRDDQQVYLINQAGTAKVGVIVASEAPSIRTKDTLHSLEIEIELPELFTV